MSIFGRLRNHRDSFLGILAITVMFLGLTAISAPAQAGARLVNVIALDGGCLSGPTGVSVESWDAVPGKSYQLTIDQVTECADGGMAPTLNVRVNNTAVGNTDLIATWVSPGIYQFSYTLPVTSCETFPIFYCTTPGASNTGTLVVRHDTGQFQAHLRAATFGPACSLPAAILCLPTPTRPSTWGQVKSIYR